MDLDPCDVHGAFVEIDAEVANREHGLGALLPSACRVAQRDADARQKLAGTKGLREVIIGTRIERLDLVVFLTARADYDDRGRRPLSQTLRDLEAEMDAADMAPARRVEDWTTTGLVSKAEFAR